MARSVERVGRGLGAATYLSDQQQGREVKKRIRTTAVRNAAHELRYMKKKVDGETSGACFKDLELQDI